MVDLHPGKYAASTKPKRNLTIYKSVAFRQAAVAVEIAPHKIICDAEICNC